MNFEEYQAEASQTAHYPKRFSNLEYPTLGLTGEAGEVANIVKKIQRDHAGVLTDEVRGKLKDELGDYLNGREIKSLLKRRNEIVERFEKLGPDALFDLKRPLT